MSEHTKGLLHYKADDESELTHDIMSGEWYVATTHDGCESLNNSKENARRLVACWNACEGSPTEGLEEMVSNGRSVANMAMLYERAMDRRDELLAALKGLVAIAETELADPEDLSEMISAKAAIIMAESK